MGLIWSRKQLMVVLYFLDLQLYQKNETSLFLLLTWPWFETHSLALVYNIFVSDFHRIMHGIESSFFCFRKYPMQKKYQISVVLPHIPSSKGKTHKKDYKKTFFLEFFLQLMQYRC